MNLKDFIQLAGEQGKVLVIGDDGNVKGVFLPFDEYQKLAGHKIDTAQETKEDIAEKVNQEILQAQLEEVIAPADGGVQSVASAERLDTLLNKRASELFKSKPYNAGKMHNFIAAPDVATSSDEESILPNFDDI